MLKKILTMTLAVAAFLSLSKVSSAIDPAIDLNIKKKLNPAVFEAAKKIICEKTQSKIEEKKVTFEERKVKHTQAYNNLQDRLEKLSDKLSAKGYDASALDEDIAVLDEKIGQFEADFVAALENVEESKSFVCGNGTPIDKKNELKETRELIKKIRQDSVGIRNYYKNTIRLDILAIKKQVPNR